MSLSPELIELVKALSGAGAGVTINVHHHAAGSNTVFKTGCIEFSGGFTPAQSATTGTTANPAAPAKAERFTPPILGALKAAPTAPAPAPATEAAEVVVEAAEPEPAPEGEVVISYDDDPAPESEPTPQPAAVEPAVIAEPEPASPPSIVPAVVEPVVQPDPAPAPPAPAAPRPTPRALADQLKAMRPRTED